jgi:hypothetical protein
MKDFPSRWDLLTAAAREAPARADAAAPYGFATRVVAQAFSPPPGVPWLAAFRPFSLRALWLAGVLMLASMAANYVAFASGEEDEQSVVDPVSEVLSAL